MYSVSMQYHQAVLMYYLTCNKQNTLRGIRRILYSIFCFLVGM